MNLRQQSAHGERLLELGNHAPGQSGQAVCGRDHDDRYTGPQRLALPGFHDLPGVEPPQRQVEDDQRWQKFLNRWSEWNVMLGYNEKRMKKSLKTLGIDEIPSTVSFSPN